MKKMSLTLLFAATVALAMLSGQTPGGTPFRIEKLDPALDDIVSPAATLEVLGDRFALAEGPVWVPEREAGQDGYLLFSDNAGMLLRES